MASSTNVRALRLPATSEEEFRRDGSEALTDAELLAHLPPGKAVEVAHQALAQAGSLRRLLDLPHETVTSLPGVSNREHIVLAAAREIGQRYVATSIELSDPVRDAKDLVAALPLVRVRVLDHHIIGEERCFSFVEQGLL